MLNEHGEYALLFGASFSESVVKAVGVTDI